MKLGLFVSLLLLAPIAAGCIVEEASPEDAASDAEEVVAATAPKIGLQGDRVIAPDLRTTSAFQELALSTDTTEIAFLEQVPYGLSDMHATRFRALGAAKSDARFGFAQGFDLVSVLPGANGGAILEPRLGNVQFANAVLDSKRWVKLRMTHASDNDVFHVGKYAAAMKGSKIEVTFGGGRLTTLTDGAGFRHAPIRKGPTTTCKFTPSLEGVAIAPVRRVVVVKVAQTTSNDACSLPAQIYAFRLPPA